MVPVRYRRMPHPVGVVSRYIIYIGLLLQPERAHRSIGARVVRMGVFHLVDRAQSVVMMSMVIFGRDDWSEAFFSLVPRDATKRPTSRITMEYIVS